MECYGARSFYRAIFHCLKERSLQADPVHDTWPTGWEADKAWTRRKGLYLHDFEEDSPTAINYAEVQPAAFVDEQTWDVGVFLNKERTELLQMLQK